MLSALFAGCGILNFGERPASDLGDFGSVRIVVWWPEESPTPNPRFIAQAATTVEITITASDISTPITGSIPRPATELTLRVPSGTGRTIEAKAKGSDGTVLSRGSVTTNVAAGQFTSVEVVLSATDAATPDIVIASASPNPALVNQTVSFSGSASDADGSIVKYEWDFDGDGTYDYSSTTSASTTHAYASFGDYNAVLRFTDNDGLTGTMSVLVQVNAPPTVTASVDNATPNVGQTVNFSMSASDPDGTIVKYEWDFEGDGTYNYTSTANGNTSHAYAASGSYTATARVTDNDGLSATDTINVDVSGLTVVRAIVFGASHPTWTDQSDLFWIDADGTGLTQLTYIASYDFQPAWSPDGSKIAFATDRDGDQEIYVMNADLTGLTNLTNNPSGDTDPTWSPDGTKIAFESSRSGNLDIWIMNADGTGQTNLTNSPDLEYDPAWSPDGTTIAFSSRPDAGQDTDIFVIKMDGTGRRTLTNDPSFDSAPAWSPDGTRIAFTRDLPGYEVFVMNADGSGQTNLSNSDGIDQQPCWSPDRTKIAFVSARARDGNLDLYVMNSDGTSVMRLTYDAAYEQGPAWRPAVGPGYVDAIAEGVGR